MKFNTPRGAALRYISAKGIARKEGDLEFLQTAVKSFMISRPRLLPVIVAVPVARVRPLTIRQIVMRQREMSRG